MKSYKFAPIEARGQAAALWLIISMLADAVSFALSAFDLHMLSRLDTLTEADISRWEMTELVGWSTVVVYLITVVVVCFWIYRASANAHAFRKGLETPPAWAVGWYFIPFANFWKPFTAMKDIWRVSFVRDEGSRAPSDGILGGWWTFWVLSGVTGNISFRVAAQATEPSSYVTSAWFAIASAITGILAALYLRSIIRQVSAAQTATQAFRKARQTETELAGAASTEPTEAPGVTVAPD